MGWRVVCSCHPFQQGTGWNPSLPIMFNGNDEGIWIPGVGDITPEVIEALRSKEVARQYVALRETREMAKAGRERFHLATGEVKMQIHPVSYHYWGQRLGYECWADKQFCEDYLADNDYARVVSRGRNPMVGWTPGLKGQGAATKYCKRQSKVLLAA